MYKRQQLKRIGESPSPWRTPMWIGKESLSSPTNLILETVSVKVSLTKFRVLGPTPHSCRRKYLMIYFKLRICSRHDLPFLKLPWYSPRWGLSWDSSLLRRSLEKILYKFRGEVKSLGSYSHLFYCPFLWRGCMRADFHSGENCFSPSLIICTTCLLYTSLCFYITLSAKI